MILGPAAFRIPPESNTRAVALSSNVGALVLLRNPQFLWTFLWIDSKSVARAWAALGCLQMRQSRIGRSQRFDQCRVVAGRATAARAISELSESG
ncbi:hypothetical protein, partial [Falsiroseomonas sp. HW251]|uniref:hypothetical protein n=1 Tax=Falsiroseomonas sp. HW251 TaxID=3390998 RepID=UPI003D31646B